MIILGLHATNADHKCDYFSILWAPRSTKLSGKVLSGIVGRWRSQRCIIHPSSDEVDHKEHERFECSNGAAIAALVGKGEQGIAVTSVQSRREGESTLAR